MGLFARRFAAAGFVLSLCAATAAFSAVDPARFFSYRYSLLLTARQLAKASDPLIKDALAKLKSDADGALKAPRYSVMDKTRVPPSGDKHDYLSLAPYWWPDSTKPGGIPYIQRDGLTNPESRGPEYDATRIGNFTGDVEALVLCYFLAGDTTYAKKAADQLRAWFLDPATRMNPNMKYGQGAPGVADGRNFGIIQTRSFMDLVDEVAMLGGYPGWTAADQKGLVDWFGKYADWMQTDSLGQQESAQPNNHGTWYDAQLSDFSLFAGRPDVAARVCRAAKTRRLGVQITKSGMQPLEMTRTKSLFYHCFNLSALYHLARIAENAGVDLWGYASPDSGTVPDLRRALDFVAPYADSTKKWPNEQILDFDHMNMFPTLMEAALVYQDPSYLQKVGYLDPKAVATTPLRVKYPFDKVPSPMVGTRWDAKPARRALAGSAGAPEPAQPRRAADGRWRFGWLWESAP